MVKWLKNGELQWEQWRHSFTKKKDRGLFFEKSQKPKTNTTYKLAYRSYS